MEFEPMEECVFYHGKTKSCKALNKLYCKSEECNFYKSRNQCDDEGEEKTKNCIIRTKSM